MGRIRVLSDSLVNRIAAGEVVERPASVVKELIENAIDAGARSIVVAGEGGGTRLVRVTDDGAGMDRDDALLALERHATSKLRDAADLDAIATLGFRGEALASIAAVSRLLLRTSSGDGPGTEVEVHAGTIRAVREIGMARGTTVEVGRLFANVPARRKFLRAEATELAHVARVVTRYALIYPALRLRLEHGGRAMIVVEPAPDLAARVAQIYGREFRRKLLDVRRDAPGVRIDGLVGRPADATTSRDAQQLFVNGRWVQDRLLGHALAEAYRNTVPHGRRAWAFLRIEVDPASVDVNVHPQKTEVRFRNSGEVHDQVRDAVLARLGGASAVPTLDELRPASIAVPAERPDAAAALARGRWVGSPEELPRTLAEPARPAWLDGPAVRPLAQYRDSYIVAADARGLVLVDQHAAHERVLFERYLAEARENRVETQQLLFPQIVELAPAERVVVEQEADEFRRLGFVLESFGGSAVRIDGVPSFAGELDAPDLIRELAGEAARARAASAESESVRLRLVTTAACRAAIKIHHALSLAEMQRLLDDLFAMESPGTCPHGRPVVFRLEHDEIERAFRRR